MKKRLILLTMCFLLSLTDLFSINKESLDTLVYLNEIKFHSDLEKEAFLEYFDGEETLMKDVHAGKEPGKTFAGRDGDRMNARSALNRQGGSTSPWHPRGDSQPSERHL